MRWSMHSQSIVISPIIGMDVTRIFAVQRSPGAIGLAGISSPQCWVSISFMKSPICFSKPAIICRASGGALRLTVCMSSATPSTRVNFPSRAHMWPCHPTIGRSMAASVGSW